MHMRIAVLKKDKCTHGEGCNFICRSVCPVVKTGGNAIEIVDNTPVIHEELCTGCGICVKKCPAHAISIINIAEELDEQQAHRYGKNGFRLYRLPIPTKGIIGILGRNGIGKTTALNILSGNLKPNLGRYDSPPSEDEILDAFKGTETQKYLQDLYSGMKVAYKPQYVDSIPKFFSGKVKDLLKEHPIIDELNLRPIMNRDIKNLSGGELQRVAIAATIEKEASAYFFDEPSSYLDIKQRLNVARIIRSMKGYVTVVEHDLVVLDYICDNIHVMYGEQGAYGVVSHPYSVREGINAYLDGYLRDENIRFRDSSIVFRDKAPEEVAERKPIIIWPEKVIDLGEFKLRINAGDLRSMEVVGVLGPNGIGKTTFAKALAGIIPVFDMSVKISYKPQYLKADATLVRDVVNKKMARELRVNQLADRRLDSLSGGELQRVAIASCLSREADVYLLDEPSAYLDVEERISVAKLLRDFVLENRVSAIVIDHDLLFLDYISDRFMVFNGEPGVHGQSNGPMLMERGMNMFLKEMGITFRRDPVTKRPRANKPGSVKDMEQKRLGKYYYT